jgi:NADH-quinone oxidoreductase subunit G
MMRVGDDWTTPGWESALERTATALRDAGGSLGVLASASATIEELYLLNRIARGVGSQNIDHRLRRLDVRDQESEPLHPSLGMKIADVDLLDGLLVVGSNLRREVPMLAHRVRKAAKRGARVGFLNPAEFEYLFPLAASAVSRPARHVADLAAVLAAVLKETSRKTPEHLSSAVKDAKVEAFHRELAAVLTQGERRAIWLGALALRHPAYADLRALALAIAEATGAAFGTLAEGANAAGAYLAGAVPHREAGGESVAETGLAAREMLANPLDTYLLFNVEPWADTLDSATLDVLEKAKHVIAITPFASDQLKRVADIILPIGTFAEGSGTYVNLEGTWQSFPGAAQAVGEARPGWKVLRVLGNLLSLAAFDYQSSEDVREEVRRRVEAAGSGGTVRTTTHVVKTGSDAAAVIDVPMYHVDSLVRRAPSLQKTTEGRATPAVYRG